MRKFAVTGLVFALLASAALLRAQPPEMPKPQKEHEWLQQLVGEWDYNAEATMAPGEPPMKCSGTEKIRMLGGFWLISEGTIESMGTSNRTMMTLGYDPEKKKYIGTWIDSMTNHMWIYEGTLDPTGRILTLEAEGPNFTTPGETSTFRDVIEIKSRDHKVLTSSVQTDEGEWVTFMRGEYRRTK